MKKSIFKKVTLVLTAILILIQGMPMQAKAATKYGMKADTEGTYYSHNGQVAFQYGTVDKETADLIATIFDAQWYAEEYSDVVRVFGTTDEDVMLEHYLTYGIFECRQPSADFNVDAYVSSYSDLRESFGMDPVALTLHYVTHGIDEGREYTTIEKVLACWRDVQHYDGTNMETSTMVAEHVEPVVATVVTVPQCILGYSSYDAVSVNGGAAIARLNFRESVQTGDTIHINIGGSDFSITIYQYSCTLADPADQSEASSVGTVVMSSYNCTDYSFTVEDGYSYYLYISYPAR